MKKPLRHLVLILGDQLDEASSALSDFDPQQDALWMAEVAEESTHVISAKQRTTVFLSAMRHFAAHMRDQGRRVSTANWMTRTTPERWQVSWKKPSSDIVPKNS